MPTIELNHALIRKKLAATKSYQAICEIWQAGQTAATLFHLILEWIEKYALITKSQTDIADIFRRIGEGDALTNIVADFCDPARQAYVDLRTEFGKCD
jgi:hypothetical protein